MFFKMFIGFIEKMKGQGQDVFFSLPQRRDGDLDREESKKDPL